MKYFGRRWNANYTIEVPVPLGAECLWCEELIDEDDSGTFTTMLMSSGPSERAEHLECQLRSMLGSLEHLTKRCICYGGTEPTEPYREQARKVMAYLLANPGAL